MGAPVGRRAVTALRSDLPFIGLVTTDEEPVDGALVFDAEGAVGVVHPDGPVAAHALEVEGGMPVVLPPECVLLFVRGPGFAGAGG